MIEIIIVVIIIANSYDGVISLIYILFCVFNGIS